MLVSVGENNARFPVQEVQGFNALLDVICERTYSCGVFKDAHRTNDNFIHSELVALDFDGGLSIDKAREMFAEHKHIIAPTRSHQVSKGGQVQDRFRVILFLSSPITSGKVYRNTVTKLIRQYPQADKQCSDPARMYYPSQNVYSSNPNGKLIDPVIKQESPSVATAKEGVDFNKKPHGWSNCVWAIANGQFDKGEGNAAMMALASNLRKLNYTKSQAYYICKDAYENRNEDYDKESLWREVIEVIYGENWQGGVYLCSNEDTWLHDYCERLGPDRCKSTERTTFNFTSLDQMFKDMPKINWLVDGLLSVGGLSLLSGPPKSGKSTLTRQLAKSVCRGEQFLGRDVQAGRVLYLALEEQPELLFEQFQRLGMTPEDPIKLHIGGVFGPTVVEDLREYVLTERPSLIIIDTMILFAQIKDVNDYGPINEALSQLRELARESEAHICMIHHANKGGVGTGSILGSTATHGAVDCAMIFRREGQKRFVETSQRGGSPLIDQELLFDRETETYTLGDSNNEW